MKWSKLPWGWILAMAYVFALPIAVTAILTSRQLAWLPPKSSSDVAAWVQAIGSVVAIGISIFWAMRLQDREREKTAQLERLRWLQAVHGIAQACRDLIDDQDTVLNRTLWRAEFKELARPNRLATVHSAIAAVDLGKAYPGDLALAIITMQHVTSKALRFVKGAAEADQIVSKVDLGDCLLRACIAFATIEAAMEQAEREYRQ